jgi:hypothetical protein
VKTIAFFLALLVTTAIASAHSGGLDQNGGHHDHKNGGYHYHR